MKNILIALCLLLLTGCVSTDPTESKSDKGNLELNIYSTTEGFSGQFADIFIDGIYFGNISRTKPILYLKKGTHTIRIVQEGFAPVEKTIHISGSPNHQVLNILLKKQ